MWGRGPALYKHNYKKKKKTWHTAAIDGHSRFNKLLPLSRNEAAHLQAINIKTISQLYEVNDLGNLQNSPNTNIDRQIIGNPELKEKLQLLRPSLQENEQSSKRRKPRVSPSLPHQETRWSLLPNNRYIQQCLQHNRDGQPTIQNERNCFPNSEPHNLD